MLTCALVVTGVAIAGCGGGGSAPTSSPAASRPASAPASGPAGSPSASPSADPPRTPTPTEASTAAACIAQVYGQMTQAQRVGQLFLVGVSGDLAGPQTQAALRQYHFGSLLLGTNTSAGVAGVRSATAFMQSLATGANTGGARFFIAANQEGGQIQPLTGSGFSTMPSALTQGSWSVSTLREQAKD